jgi:hypothetical protein
MVPVAVQLAPRTIRSKEFPVIDPPTAMDREVLPPWTGPGTVAMNRTGRRRDTKLRKAEEEKYGQPYQTPRNMGKPSSPKKPKGGPPVSTKGHDEILRACKAAAAQTAMVTSQRFWQERQSETQPQGEDPETKYRMDYWNVNLWGVSPIPGTNYSDSTVERIRKYPGLYFNRFGHLPTRDLWGVKLDTTEGGWVRDGEDFIFRKNVQAPKWQAVSPYQDPNDVWYAGRQQ